MEIINLLRKYSLPIKLNKDSKYLELEKKVNEFKQFGFEFKCHHIFDVYTFQAIYLGILNYQKIKNCYDHLISESSDILSRLDFNQRQKIWEIDFSEIEQLTSYNKIYLPFLDVELNQKIEQFETLLLKQYQNIIFQTKMIPTIIYEYHPMIIGSNFIPLIFLDEIDQQLYYYDQNLNRIIILDCQFSFVDAFYVTDQKNKTGQSIEEMKNFILFIKENDLQEIKSWLENSNLYKEKTIKKIMKKLGK